MADVPTIPAPPPPVGTARSQVVAKQGLPNSEARRYNRDTLTGRGMRANFRLADQPTPDELRVAGHVQQLLSLARAARKSRTGDWKRWDQIMANRTWLSGRPVYLPNPEVPEIRPILSTLVAYVTDSRPSAEFAPAIMPGSDRYQWWMERCWDLQTVTESVLHVERSERELTLTVMDSYRYGAGVLKSTWDQALDGGLGNARVDRVNPYSFYPDPDATTEHDGNYYIEVRDMSLQELDRRYPGASTKLLAVTIDHDEQPDPNHPRPSLPRANPGAITGTGFDGQAAPANPGSPGYGLPGATDRAASPSEVFGDRVTVVECWVRTHEHVAPVVEDQRLPASTVEEWRCIVVVGNRVLLDADATDLYGHPYHPYSRYCYDDSDGTFWGQSMVELLASSQLQINKSLAAIAHNLDLLGNPVLKESARANIDRNTITNRAGQRLRVSSNINDVDWLSPPPIHPLHLDMVRFYIEEMERVSGLNAIARGSAPGGRNSTDVLNSVQEAGFVRVRLALRNFEYTLRDAFTKLAQLIVSNYTIPRIIAISGESGERTSLALQPRHFHMPTERGAIPLRFQILVNAGSAQPVSRSAMIEQANFLFSVGAIDRQALLEAHRFPKWQVVNERMQALDQAGLLQMQQTDARTAGRA